MQIPQNLSQANFNRSTDEFNIEEASYPLYNPDDHHDACGVGFIAEESGVASRRVVELSLKALNRLEHRGGKGFDEDTGDGAGLLVDIPWTFFKNGWRQLESKNPKPGNSWHLG